MLMLYVHFIPSLWICKVSFAKIYKFGVSGDHWQLGKASGLPHSDDLSYLALRLRPPVVTGSTDTLVLYRLCSGNLSVA